MESIQFVVLPAESQKKQLQLKTDRIETERQLLDIENLGTQDNFF